MREEAGGEEEADRVMAVPPLEHRILHAAPQDYRLRGEDRDRDRRVVAEMQHRDREDEGEIEPVGHEDMRLLAAEDRAEEHQQIGDPDDRQPEVGVPLGLGVFLAFGDAEQIARAGDHDEEVVAEHHEPRREIARQPRAAGALHDIERGRQQHVAAEGEDHGRGVQRTQAPEVEPGRDVEPGIGELEGDVDAYRHAREAPEQSGERSELYRPEIIVGPAVDLERRRSGRARVVALEDREDAAGARRSTPSHIWKAKAGSIVLAAMKRHVNAMAASTTARLTSPTRSDLAVLAACIRNPLCASRKTFA